MMLQINYIYVKMKWEEYIMSKTTERKTTVLAFEKKMVASDGYMYQVRWDTRTENAQCIRILEKSVRGTISNRLTKKEGNDPLKLDAKIANPNPQTVDSASLDLQHDTLKLCFTLKFLSGVAYPSACNNEEHYKKISHMVQSYLNTYGFKEVAKRYALNIANGRFLWRNRVGTEKIEIVVHNKEQQKTWTFNGHAYDLTNFEDTDEQVEELATCIDDALCGKVPYFFIDVTAYALLGNGQEVYPSEELVLNKTDDTYKKSKILYQVNEIAAMHSQKINNALRTIDTWYPEYQNTGKPIAIEPYGAVTTIGKGYRTPKEKQDFYTLFDKYSKGDEPFATQEEADYVMAMLVRGGVFGESGKE